MHFWTLLRRAALVLVLVAFVAGCATPQEAGPEDLHQDGDRDGIPDGNSPVPGANETDETAQNVTESDGSYGQGSSA